jgi:hypothetical protein
MAKKKFKKLTDEELLARLDENLKGGISHYDTVLSKERQDVLDYYHGKKPVPAHAGNSKYVSMDVWDTVESAKATLLEVFAAGNEIAEFTPQGPEDVEMARVASVYTDYAIFRQNDGYHVFSQVLHDGLMSRVGVAKVYWDKEYCDEEETFEDVPLDVLDAMLTESDDLTLKDMEEDPMNGTASGTVVRRVNKSQVRIDPVPAEEFLIAPTAKSLRETHFCAHRVKKTVAELVQMGLSVEEALNVPVDGISEMYDADKISRFQDLNAETSPNREFQDQMREVTVHECYIRIDIEGNGYPKLWKITKAGEHLLDREEIDRHPFVPFVPLPIPHAFYGSNFAHKVIPIQNARTVLMRGILDHTVNTNNPRMMVVKGALVNPRELIDNRVGGLVNVTRPDGLMPMPQASLNPFVFQTIQLLDEDKEDTTGVSKLSQGLNKDAVSKQNSQAMIEQLVGLSQQRQKIIARNFANQFIIPLFLEVYNLIIKNEDRKKIIEVAGNFVEVEPRKWSERTGVTVKLKLGYGEREQTAAQLMGLHQFLSQDPGAAPMYDMPQKHNLITDYLALIGYKDNRYLKPLQEVKPPPPPPDLMAEVEKMKAETAAITQKTQLEAVQAQFKMQLDEMKHQLEKSNRMIELMVSQRDMERKEFEAKSRHDIGMRELAMMESQDPNEVKQTQIVSPNG